MRLVRRRSVGLFALALALGALAPVALEATVVAAAPGTLFAAPSSNGTGSCLSTPDACSLTVALTKVKPGGTIELVVAGNQSDYSTLYDGPYDVTTTGTSQALPVKLVGPEAGAIIDGEESYAGIVNGADFLDVTNVSFQNSGNAPGLINDLGGTVDLTNGSFSEEYGGSILNADNLVVGGVGGGTVNLTDVSFPTDQGLEGGAIDNVDGTVNVTGSMFESDVAGTGGGAIANGVSNGGSTPVAATLHVTDSYFSEDFTEYDNGGAIDNGDDGGRGTATITDSGFFADSSSTAAGGAISNGADHGTGVLTISESTLDQTSAFTDGGAIENGESGGTGTLVAEHDTFIHNTANTAGAAIDNEDGGTGHVTVGASAFADGCSKGANGVWDDLGYNAGNDSSCFGAGDLGDSTGPVAADTTYEVQYGSSFAVGVPTAGNPAIGLVPLVAHALCPVGADERGIPSPSDGPCDAGAVQDPVGAIVHLSGAPLPASPGAVAYTVKVQGFGGLSPSGTVQLSDGKGRCTTPALSATSVALVTAASCAIPGESAKGSPYVVTATYAGGGSPFGTSVASIVQASHVANGSGSVSTGEGGVSAAATGGTPGKDALTQSEQSVNPNPVPLPYPTAYYDVATSKGAKFKKVTIDTCAGVTTSGEVQWWSPAKAKKSATGDGWEKVVGTKKQAVVKQHGKPCIEVTLDAKTSPSLAQLSGTSFAVQSKPLVVSPKSLLLKERVRRFGRIFLGATGGNAPYHWHLSSGSLPKGLSLSSKGELSGTPTSKGTSFVTVQLSDTGTSTYKQQVVQATITVEITS